MQNQHPTLCQGVALLCLFVFLPVISVVHCLPQAIATGQVNGLCYCHIPYKIARSFPLTNHLSCGSIFSTNRSAVLRAGKVTWRLKSNPSYNLWRSTSLWYWSLIYTSASTWHRTYGIGTFIVATWTNAEDNCDFYVMWLFRLSGLLLLQTKYKLPHWDFWAEHDAAVTKVITFSHCGLN